MLKKAVGVGRMEPGHLAPRAPRRPLSFFLFFWAKAEALSSA